MKRIARIGIVAACVWGAGPGWGAGGAEITLVGKASIGGRALDRSQLPGNILTNDGKDTGIPQAVFGGAGSAIDYTGTENVYLMAPDRGPGDGGVKYMDRVEYVRIEVMPGSDKPVTVENTRTVLLTNGAGVNFCGAATGLTAESPRLDPEGVRMAKDPAIPGSYWISDEYGPYVYHFDRLGKKIGEFELPAKYGVQHPGADGVKELAENTMGRQPNRGMEGLAITPDGKMLVGMMQNALIQDHGVDEAQARSSNFTRIITMNLADGTTHEYVYAMDSNKFGINEILAINDHEFLVVERDGKAAAESAAKKIFRIDLKGATDISQAVTAGDKTYNYSGTTAENGLPAKGPIAGVTPVSKVLFMDLLSPTYGLAGPNFPEKIEGLAWGPDLANGDKLLIVTSDNDFMAEAPTWFYAFRVAGLNAGRDVGHP